MCPDGLFPDTLSYHISLELAYFIILQPERKAMCYFLRKGKSEQRPGCLNQIVSKGII